MRKDSLVDIINFMAVEVFGICAVVSMLVMYALEDRSPVFVLGFAAACAASSFYAVLIQSWPFAIVEGIWSVVAVRRWLAILRSDPQGE